LLCYARPSVWYDFNLLQLAFRLEVGCSQQVDLFDVRAYLQPLVIVPTARPGRGRADVRRDLGHSSRDLNL
jgi:hypothetical protein